jgi:hypothetical protein
LQKLLQQSVSSVQGWQTGVQEPGALVTQMPS